MSNVDIFLADLARQMIEDCMAIEQDDNSVWIEIDKKVWNAYWAHRAEVAQEQSE